MRRIFNFRVMINYYGILKTIFLFIKVVYTYVVNSILFVYFMDVIN